MKITLLRQGNVVVIDPAPQPIRALLEPELAFVEEKELRGKERRERRTKYVRIRWLCYSYDARGRMGISLGFFDRVWRRLRRAGYSLEFVDHTTLPRPRAYEPDWDHFYEQNEGTTFRHRQEEAIEVFPAYPCGRIMGPTGWGKGSIIRFGCQLMRRARIAVVTRSATVLEQRLFPELCLNMPDVGIISGGRRANKHARVVCFSSGCLGYSDGDFDYVFYDEGHEAAADGTAEGLARAFPHARMFALSASFDMRTDGKDMRVEGIFGPIRFSMPYQEAVAHAEIVNLKVVMRSVLMDENPAAGYRRSDKRLQHGIWRNHYRNTIIAQDCQLYPGRQVVAAVDTIEHALHLRALLPGATLFYAAGQLMGQTLVDYEEEGLIPTGHRPMTQDRCRQVADTMIRGTPGIYICTPKINVGVDLKYLDVLVRCNARRSAIQNTQLPGRNSRKNDQGKLFGVIHDYRDEFDGGFKNNSAVRVSDYTAKGWEIIQSHADESKLRAAMTWGQAGARSKRADA